MKWEYKRVTCRGNDDEVLAEAGADGWELVLTQRADFVFKRPVAPVPATQEPPRKTLSLGRK